MKKASEIISELLLPKIQEENLYLVEVKVLQNKIVQIFVDGLENVTINQCANISRFIEPFLDEGKIVPVDYQLEVSSPGMSNPLKVPMQYIKRIGRTLDITTNKGMKHSAVLKHADDEKIIVEEIIEIKKNKKQLAETPTPKEIELKYSDIKTALLQIKFK
jgi:ribosome maturation factor RimP